MQTLRKHSSDLAAVEWGFNLVSSLADYKPTLNCLFLAGVFECLVESLQR